MGGQHLFGLLGLTLALAQVNCAGKKRDFGPADESSTVTEDGALLPGAPNQTGARPGQETISPNETGEAGPQPAGFVCGGGTHACQGVCVSNYEPATCGSSCDGCPVPLGGTATCDGVTCGASCPGGQQLCGTACIDVAASCNGNCQPGSHDCDGVCKSDESTSSCGASCTACPVPENGSATCDGGACGLACDANFHLCDGACVRDTDVDSCGLSCEACPVPSLGTATCDGTRCGGSCPAGSKLCAGACIPEAQACLGVCPEGTHDCAGTCQSDTSVNACGGDCMACPAPSGNGVAVCNAGTCGISCNAGLRLCGDACRANNSLAACGPACAQCPIPNGGGATCDNGKCGTFCRAGSNLCGNSCVPNSPTSCGPSCSRCAAPPSNGSATCNGGLCGISCSAGFVPDSGRCERAPECVPGDSVCINSTTAQACSALGFWQNQSCAVQCARGRCVDPPNDASLVGCNLAEQLVCTRRTEQCCQNDGIFGPITCESLSASCPSRFVTCDGVNECNPGQVCCFTYNSAVSSLSCKAPEECVEGPPRLGARTRLRLVCDPSNPVCPTGAQCLPGTPFVDLIVYYCLPDGESL